MLAPSPDLKGEVFLRQLNLTEVSKDDNKKEDKAEEKKRKML